MQWYRLPERVSALIFDMDSTLYTHPDYIRFQVDCLIRRAGLFRGETFEETREEVARRRKAWADSRGGEISLGAVFSAMGIPMEQSIRWREELIEPALFLGKDPKLRRVLETLSSAFALSLVTNNPVLVARKTLRALGVEDFFTILIGLDTCGVPKPHRAPFIKAGELLRLAPEFCVSVGDRYDIDIALPLELGMGGILVKGVEDVYSLPSVLDGRAFSCKL